jgi:hypothetical protein
MDYVEQATGKTLLAGHGVIGWDAKQKHYTLHWFDTFGSPPGARIFKIEMNVDGKGWKPIIEGEYRRAGPARNVSEEDQAELDRATARS